MRHAVPVKIKQSATEGLCGARMNSRFHIPDNNGQS